MGHLVSVRTLFAHAVFPHADVTVRVNHARQDEFSAELNHLCAIRREVSADGDDLAVINQNIAGKVFLRHGVNLTVFQ